MLEAKKIVEKCDCGGKQADTSCYNCLRSYSNQRIHDKLQRRYVLEFMEDFFSKNVPLAEEQIILPIDWDKDNGIKSPDCKETFEEQFLYVLNRSGTILNEKRRFVGLMKDILYAYPKQMNLIISLYQMDIHKALQDTAEINDIFIHRFVKKLENELGISKENAAWATKVWCEIYGVQVLKKT